MKEENYRSSKRTKIQPYCIYLVFLV